MKIYQVLLLATVVWQIRGECQCGVFTMGDEDSAKEEVFLDSTFQQSCDRLEGDQVCRDFCFENFINLTAKGDLNAISFVSNMTAGEFFCNRLKKAIFNEDLAGFYRWCQTSWKFVGFKANDKFCCTTEGNFFRCNEIKDPVIFTAPNIAVEIATTIDDVDPAVTIETEFRPRRDITIETDITDIGILDAKSITDQPLAKNTDIRFEGQSVGNNAEDFASNDTAFTDGLSNENNVRETLTKRDIAKADVILIKTGRRHPSTFRIITTTTETSIANQTIEHSEPQEKAIQQDFVSGNVTTDAI